MSFGSNIVKHLYQPGQKFSKPGCEGANVTPCMEKTPSRSPGHAKEQENIDPNLNGLPSSLSSHIWDTKFPLLESLARLPKVTAARGQAASGSAQCQRYPSKRRGWETASTRPRPKSNPTESSVEVWSRSGKKIGGADTLDHFKNGETRYYNSDGDDHQSTSSTARSETSEPPPSPSTSVSDTHTIAGRLRAKGLHVGDF